MLTFAVQGTPGDDLFEILPDGDNLRECTVRLNGQVVGTTQQTDIRLSGLGGNDTFSVGDLADSNNQSEPYELELFGGLGNDVFRIGSAFCIVRVNEAPGEGVESLVVDRSGHVPGTSVTRTLTATPTSFFGRYLFDDNIEVKQVEFFGVFDLDLTVNGQTPAGLKLMLANGKNVVKFGGTVRQIDEDPLPGEIIGGPREDTIVFDDSKGNKTVNRDYSITPARFMNMTLLAVEKAEIKTRLNNTATANTVAMTGGGMVQNSIKFSNAVETGVFTPTELSIGTPSTPIDLDDLPIQVNADFISEELLRYEIWDQDVDQSGAPFVLDGDANHQRVQKGAFVARLTSAATTPISQGLRLTLNGGSTADVFNIADTLPQSRISVNGGGGDDTLATVSTATHGNAPEQVFLGIGFNYDGGVGDDLLVLDDRSAAFPGTVDEYLISTGFTKNGVTRMTHDRIDRVRFIAGGQTNIIRIDTRAGANRGKSYQIDAGFGNDTITTFVPGLNGGALGANVNIELVGGSGNDTLVIDDTLPESQTSQYSLDAGAFSYSGNGAGTFTFDSTLENIILVQNNGSSVTQLRAKRPDLNLDFNAGGGDDLITVGGGDFDASGLFNSNTSLIGGAGSDSITFDDHLDTTGKTYTFNPFTLTAGTQQVTYSSFEAQTLNASDVVLPGFFLSNFINITGISGQIDRTTINGGNNRRITVNLGSGNVAVASNVTIDFGLAGGDLNINDQSSTVFPSSYQVASNAFVKTSTGQTIAYSGVDRLTLNTSALADSVTVSSVAPGMSVTVNSNAGNDTLSMGNGNLELNLKGPVVMNGGAGTDTGFFTNTFDNTPATQVLNGMSLTDSGITHSFTGLEALRLNEGPGGTNLTINSTNVQTNVSGNSGSDTFTVGGGDIDANFPSGTALGLFIDGAGGNDSIRFDDLNDTNFDSYEFQRPNGTDQLVKNDGGVRHFLSWASIEGVTLDASNATSTGPATSVIVVLDLLTPLRINGNAGNDRVIINDAAAPVVVHTGPGDRDSMDINQDFDAGPAIVVIEQDDEIEDLEIRAGGVLRIATGATLVKTRAAASPGGLNIAGVLDLAGGALLSRAGGPTPAAFRSQIIAGRNGGAWNGTSAAGAINSSMAAGSTSSDGVGYGLGSEIAPTTIGGFSIAPSDTLLRYTLDGDANLDAQVNLADFNRLAANFGQSNRSWVDGDSTYDGNVNLSDFNTLAANFGTTFGPEALRSNAIRGPRGGDELRELLEELA